MTVQEAINELKELSKIENAPLASEAAKMGAEALQKQVPMKPKVIAGKYTWLYRCTTCNGWLEKNEKYCECGQRILWEDEK